VEESKVSGEELRDPDEEITHHSAKEEEPFDEGEIVRPEQERQNLEDIRSVPSVVERNRNSLA
jgi:hypothetical protein